jgi:hypothetical protein
MDDLSREAKRKVLEDLLAAMDEEDGRRMRKHKGLPLEDEPEEMGEESEGEMPMGDEPAESEDDDKKRLLALARAKGR